MEYVHRIDRSGVFHLHLEDGRHLRFLGGAGVVVLTPSAVAMVVRHLEKRAAHVTKASFAHELEAGFNAWCAERGADPLQVSAEGLERALRDAVALGAQLEEREGVRHVHAEQRALARRTWRRARGVARKRGRSRPPR